MILFGNSVPQTQTTLQKNPQKNKKTFLSCSNRAWSLKALQFVRGFIKSVFT